MMNEHLTYQQFSLLANRFYEQSVKIGDEWQLVSFSQNVQFLAKRCYNVGAQEITVSGKELSTPINYSHEHEDSATSITEPCSNIIDYHVIYSPSYSVPVLYINARHQDGRLLGYDEMHQIFAPSHSDCMKSQIWTTMTQVEHPVFQTPTYMLHPCKTATMMSNVLPQLPEGSRDSKYDCYLLQWLSSVGPAVGLTLPCGYLTDKQALRNGEVI